MMRGSEGERERKKDEGRVKRVFCFCLEVRVGLVVFGRTDLHLVYLVDQLRVVHRVHLVHTPDALRPRGHHRDAFGICATVRGVLQQAVTFGLRRCLESEVTG